MSAFGALAVMAVKPMLDIPGRKVPYNTLDAGMVGSGIGAAFMIGAFAAVCLLVRRVRVPMALTIGMIAVLLVLSGIDLLLQPTRTELLAVFELPKPELFGPYIPPVKGTAIATGQLVVGFAAFALLSGTLTKPDLLPSPWLRWTLLFVVAGALVHVVIAWLQVAGLVPYFYHFRLPGGSIGRASGAYPHPALLGNLLIFCVFFLYVARARLGLSTLWRYCLIGAFFVTALVTLHRMTIAGIAIVIAVFEVIRFASRPRSASLHVPRLRTALPVGAGLLLLAGLLVILRGPVIWDRTVLVTTQIGFLRGRGAIWSDIAKTWADAPAQVWLTGLGFEPWNTHNDLIRVAVVWGLLGVLAMTALFVNVWITVWQRTTRAGRQALVLLYAFLAMIAATQKPTSYPYVVWLFVLGLMALVAFHARRPDSGDGAETGSVEHR